MTTPAKAADIKWPIPPEKEVQRQIVAFFRTLGFVVVSTSQYRASGMTVGLPDLIGYHLVCPLQFWFEVKKPRAKTPNGRRYNPHDPLTWEPEPLRPEQERFRQRCSNAGHLHGFGGIHEAWALAERMGFGFADSSLRHFQQTDTGKVRALEAARILASESPMTRGRK